MMDDDSIIAVVQAHKEGKNIQFCSNGVDWFLCDSPNWNFNSYRYRVAPEPRKPREWILIEDSNGELHSRYYSLCQKSVRVREVIE